MGIEVKKRYIALVATSTLVGLLTAVPASASTSTGNCVDAGSTWTLSTPYYATVYKSKMAAGTSGMYVWADLQWRAPTPGARLTWYYGAQGTTTAYSPGVPKTNTPALKQGTIPDGADTCSALRTW